VTGFSGDVWLRLTNESVSTRATVRGTTVGLEDLGGKDPRGSLASEAVGHSTDSLSTGLCAVGLDDEDPPAKFDAEGRDEQVEFAFAVYTGLDSDPKRASNVTGVCGR
jgi:hypothetical protein